MFRKTTFLIAIIGLLLAASCAPAAVTPAPASIATQEPSSPVTGMAVVQSVEIQILETQPIQVNAIVRGQLPDAGCTTISSVVQVRDGNTIKVTLTTTTDPLALCAQALTPFEQSVSLDVSNLPPGTYIVNVNGLEQSFEIPIRDAFQLKQMLVDALNARDYNALKAFMAENFMIGYWQSEGTSNTPDQAIELFQRSLLNSAAPITADYPRNLIELLGTDPVTILGPDVIEASPLFTSGWGAEGRDEAILFVARHPNGNLYWHGFLFAKDGFVKSGPVVVRPVDPAPTQPTPGLGTQEIPTIIILSALEDESVTIQALHFPADTKFQVRMDKMGTGGVGGILVDSFNSKRGGSFVATFEIPEKLYGEKKIAIRLESSSGYYSYNWFDNDTFERAQSDPLPTHVEYVMAQQDVSIHSGPAKHYSIVGWIDDGQIIRVTGVSVNGKWWRVTCPGHSGGNCWVLAKSGFTKPMDPPGS